MSSTNQRRSLLIRGVICQSAGVNYWSAEKIKMPKTDPKKVPSQKFVFARTSRYNDPTFYEKKNSHFTIPLKAFTFTLEFQTSKSIPIYHFYSEITILFIINCGRRKAWNDDLISCKTLLYIYIINFFFYILGLGKNNENCLEFRLNVL